MGSGPSSSTQHFRISHPRARARPNGCSCCQPLLSLTQPTAQPGLLPTDFWAAAVAAFRSRGSRAGSFTGERRRQRSHLQGGKWRRRQQRGSAQGRGVAVSAGWLCSLAAQAAGVLMASVYVQRVPPSPALRGEGLAFPSRGLRRRRGAALQAAQHGNQLQRGVLWTPRSRRDQQTGAGVRPRAAAEGQGSCSRAGPRER